jgi:hypothetical protein
LLILSKEHWLKLRPLTGRGLCFLVMSKKTNKKEEKLKEEKCVERKRRRKRNVFRY